MVRHSQGRVLAQEKKTAEESVCDAVSGGKKKSKADRLFQEMKERLGRFQLCFYFFQN